MPMPPEPVGPGPVPTDECSPSANDEIGPWELHSELVLVCPELRARALELLPERDPDAFLARPREPQLTTITIDEDQRPTSLPMAVAGYALLRLIEIARTALVTVACVVALALLADVLH